MSDEEKPVDAAKPEKPKKAAAKPQKKSPKPAGNGVSFPGAVAMSVLAAGAGALGGAAISRAYMPRVDTVDLAPIEKTIADLEKAGKSSEAKLNRLENTQNKLSRQSAPEPVDLSDILGRLDQLERAEAPATDLSPLETRLSALEAGEVAETADMDFSRLYARIDALEKREVAASEPVDLGDIERRLTALENRSQPVPARDIRAIPPFPKQAVLDALSTSEPDKKRNWFQRALDSQITIVDDEDLKTVDVITTLLERGDIDGALIEIGTLPPEAQDALSDWMQSVTGESAE